MSNGSYYVYLLFRYDGRPMYVGLGRGSRWMHHESSTSLKKNSRKTNSIKKTLAAINEVPKIKLAEDLTRFEAFVLEIFWISTIGRHPYGPLLNETDGGDGIVGYKHTEESRAKFRARKLSAESLTAWQGSGATARRGSINNEEHCRRISETLQRNKNRPGIKVRRFRPDDLRGIKV